MRCRRRAGTKQPHLVEGPGTVLSTSFRAILAIPHLILISLRPLLLLCLCTPALVPSFPRSLGRWPPIASHLPSNALVSPSLMSSTLARRDARLQQMHKRVFPSRPEDASASFDTPVASLPSSELLQEAAAAPPQVYSLLRAEPAPALGPSPRTLPQIPL